MHVLCEKTVKKRHFMRRVLSRIFFFPIVIASYCKKSFAYRAVKKKNDALIWT